MKLNSRATDLKICSKLFRVVLPLIQCVLRFSATSVRRQRGKVSNRKITRTFFENINGDHVEIFSTLCQVCNICLSLMVTPNLRVWKFLAHCTHLKSK